MILTLILLWLTSICNTATNGLIVYQVFCIQSLAQGLGGGGGGWVTLSGISLLTLTLTLFEMSKTPAYIEFGVQPAREGGGWLVTQLFIFNVSFSSSQFYLKLFFLIWRIIKPLFGGQRAELPSWLQPTLICISHPYISPISAAPLLLPLSQYSTWPSSLDKHCLFVANLIFKMHRQRKVCETTEFFLWDWPPKHF